MITSRDNKLIREVQQLKEKKFSRKSNLCIVESYKIIKELSSKNLIEMVLTTEKNIEKVMDLGVSYQVISEEICKYISDAVTSDGVIAIAKVKPNDTEKVDFKRCLVLDNIQDPSNLGAIIRSACAFGYKTILAINSVYPYTFKCIRSSMGYIFDIDYMDISIEELIELKNKKQIDFVVADMSGKEVDKVNAPNGNLALVIGSEGQGVSQALRGLADLTVSIPMQNNVESLNASVSASIIMYLLKE